MTVSYPRRQRLGSLAHGTRGIQAARLPPETPALVRKVIHTHIEDLLEAQRVIVQGINDTI